MRSRKILSLLLCVLTLAACLSGCHGNVKRAAFAVPENFDTSREYEITFWAKNDSNITQAEIYRQAIEDFQKLYPNIHVKLALYTDYGRLYQDVITNISTDTTPNVCITYPDHIATYRTGNNTVVALDALFTHEKYGLGGSAVKFDAPTKEELIPKFLDECYQDGGYYAVPYMRSTEACYINKTYVEKLGYQVPDVLTWDFIWEVSMAATEKNPDGTYKVNGKNTLLPFMYKSTDNMMITYLKQADAGYSNALGQVQLFNNTTLELLEAVRDHTQAGAFATFKSATYPANFLNAGECIFAIDSTAGATWMGCDAPNVDIDPSRLVEFETVVRAVPQLDPANPRMISQGPSMCIFNKEDPQVVLASWLFAQFMLTNDVQLAYAQTEGYVPVTSKAQESEAYKAYLAGSTDKVLHYPVKLEATKLFLDNIQNTFVTPVFVGSADLRDASGHLIESVVKSTKRKQTVDAAYFDALFADTATLYHLDAVGNTVGGKAHLGPLPTGAIVLLCTLGGVWFLLGASALMGALRKNRHKKQKNS